VTLSPAVRRMLPALLIALVIPIVAACIPGATGGPGSSPTPPAPPLTPAPPGADPVSLLAWLFTPIFQTMFIVMVAVYEFLYNLGFPGAIAWAIVVLTLVVRAVLIPLYRKQLVSQRRMQLLQPELKEIQRRFKGDSMKVRLAQQELMRERGVNALAGCLPLLLQLPLLFIMYSVIQNGLTNVDPSAMLTVFGQQIVPLTCTNLDPVTGVPNAALGPCIDTVIPFFGTSIDVSQPSTLFAIAGFGISILAVVSALLQLVQSRMMLPPADPTNDDPNVRIQRQMMLSIIQQYLIVGWGAMFPIFGWTPAFAVDHTPRFPVSMPPPPEPSKRAAILTDAQKKTTADKTIRHRERGRQGRRGRRR
jgi:YidC/Oxa1 family membrane protein insertase